MALGSAWAMALTADGPIRPDAPSRRCAPDAGVTVDIVTEPELPTQALLWTAREHGDDGHQSASSGSSQVFG